MVCQEIGFLRQPVGSDGRRGTPTPPPTLRKGGNRCPLPPKPVQTIRFRPPGLKATLRQTGVGQGHFVGSAPC
jgi:hypothetical protein